MAKKAYVGVNSKARKVIKLYVGVNGKARKVKKAYVGVAGKARLFFQSAKTIARYGLAANLNSSGYWQAGTNNNNYAIFASTNNKTTTSYNKSLTKGTPTTLTNNYDYTAGASVGNYGIIMQTEYYGGYVFTAYDGSLTKTDVDNSGTYSYGASSAYGVSIPNYALFIGSDRSRYGKAYALDSSLTIHALTDPGIYFGRSTITRVGNYALIGGALNNYSESNKVEAYNSSLTKSVPTALAANGYYYTGAYNSNYGLFGGGYNGSNYISTVNAYNASLVRSLPTALSVARCVGWGGHSDDNAIFASYTYWAGDAGNNKGVEVYDSSLVKYTADNMTNQNELVNDARGGATATIGDYVLFSVYTSPGNVEAYKAQ